MFSLIEDADIASYADDNTPCVSADNVYGAIKSFEEASEILSKLFNDNLMKITVEKRRLLVNTNNTVKKGHFGKTNSKSEKLLGAPFDHKLSFDDHISNYAKGLLKRFMHYQE